MSCIRRLLPLLLLLSPGLSPGLFPAARAQSGEEEAEYRNLSVLRERAREAPREDAVRAFENQAQRYLRRYPGGRHASIVELWRGDLLKGIDAREAYAAYRRSREPEADERAADLAFRNEEPPPLEVERWVGGPAGAGVARAAGDLGGGGEVRVLVFFSETHPVTRKLVPYLARLGELLKPRGLEVLGVAAVVDDHANQRPDQLAEKLGAAALPFPVAIDRQRSGGRRSASLERYRGDFVPWCAVIDRYGRIAWLEGLALHGNATAALERELQRLLAQPTAAELVRRVREGDAESLARLAEIRTRVAAEALLGCLGSRMDAEVRTVLAGLLPENWNPTEADAASLRKRWQTEAAKLRYNFATDRLG